MKKYTLIAILFFTFSGFNLLSAQDIAHVNSEDIIQNIPERKQIEEKLLAKKKKYEDEIKRQEKSLETYIDEMRKKYGSKSEDELKKLSAEITESQKEIQGKQKRLVDYQKKATEGFTNDQKELFQPLQEKITNAIDAVAKKKKIKYVLDISTGAIVSYKGGMDITPDVKKYLGIK